MTIKLKQTDIPVRELIKNYENKDYDGVIGYSGRLNIRPPYQRNFVYKEKQQEKVIDTILKKLHLNSIYWADNGNEQYEVLDGQQRIISICEYVKGKFTVKVDGNPKNFHNLDTATQDIILDHKLMVFMCEGTHKEKLDWFETINIAGEKLTKQEILNAVYVGEFVMDAKKHFSRLYGPAHNKGGRYLDSNGDNALKRQGFLQTALDWIVKSEGLKSIPDYMSIHQYDTDAKDLWDHFVKVINWIEETFPTYDDRMKRTDWGKIYNDNKHKKFNTIELEVTIKKLLKLPKTEIEKPKDIWPFVLYSYEDDPKKYFYFFNKRLFDSDDKRRKYEEQGHKCANCHGSFKFEEMHGDHKVSWINGGPTNYENLQMLCADCNARKGKKL